MKTKTTANQVREPPPSANSPNPPAGESGPRCKSSTRKEAPPPLALPKSRIEAMPEVAPASDLSLIHSAGDNDSVVPKSGGSLPPPASEIQRTTQVELLPSLSPPQASLVVGASSPASLAKGRKNKGNVEAEVQRTVVECPPEMLTGVEGSSPGVPQTKKRRGSIKERVDQGVLELSQARTAPDTVTKMKLGGGQPTSPSRTRGSRSKSSDLRK